MTCKHLAIVATAVATLAIAPLADARPDGAAQDDQAGLSAPNAQAPVSPCSTSFCGGDSAACVLNHSCIAFSNLCWTIKDSDGSRVGPGANVFSGDNVSVDSMCRLHLRISQTAPDTWTCSEVIAQKSFGYGTYQVTYEDTPVDDFDPNVVLALFTWSNSSAQANREMDIELSRWGDSSRSASNVDYSVQPSSRSGHSHSWLLTDGSSTSTYSFNWQPRYVQFNSSIGGSQKDWRYTGKPPTPGGENPRMNLWLFRGASPQKPTEVIVKSFAHLG